MSTSRQHYYDSKCLLLRYANTRENGLLLLLALFQVAIHMLYFFKTNLQRNQCDSMHPTYGRIRISFFIQLVLAENKTRPILMTSNELFYNTPTEQCIRQGTPVDRPAKANRTYPDVSEWSWVLCEKTKVWSTRWAILGQQIYYIAVLH